MVVARIALIGGDDGFGAAFLRLLRECEYEVDRYAEDAVDIRETERFANYDLVVAADTLADRADDAAFLNFIVAAKGFFFYESSPEPGAAPALQAPYLTRSMSPEDLVSMVNDAIWKGASASGRPGRFTPRIKADIEVTYECGGESRSSRIVSISANGVFIRTVSPPPRGTPVRLSFTLPGDEGKVDAVGLILYAIECDVERGIISRPGAEARKIVALPGVGVVFDKIPEEAREAVRAFVERRRIPG
jgi:hypothetical protein